MITLGYREYQPASELQGIINCYWTFNEPDPISVISRLPVIPDGCIDIVHVMNGKPGIRIVGPMTQPITHQNTMIFGLRFSPFFPSVFLPIPLEEIIDQSIELDNLPELRRILEDYQENLEKCISGLDQYFLRKLRKTDSLTLQSKSRLYFLLKQGLGIDEISNKIGYSRQHLSRKCKEYTGLPPKFLQRIFRVQGIIRGYDPTYGWAEIAYKLGYYDQSHMNREFKAITTMTPSGYFSHHMFQTSNIQGN